MSAPDERDQPRVLGGDAGRGVGGLPALAAGEVLGTMHGVPAPPPGFVARAELAQLRHALVDSGTQSVAITGGRRMGFVWAGLPATASWRGRSRQTWLSRAALLSARPDAAETDVRRAATLLPADAALAWVLDRLTRWGIC